MVGKDVTEDRGSERHRADDEMLQEALDNQEGFEGFFERIHLQMRTPTPKRSIDNSVYSTPAGGSMSSGDNLFSDTTPASTITAVTRVEPDDLVTPSPSPRRREDKRPPILSPGGPGIFPDGVADERPVVRHLSSPGPKKRPREEWQPNPGADIDEFGRRGKRRLTLAGQSSGLPHARRAAQEEMLKRRGAALRLLAEGAPQVRELVRTRHIPISTLQMRQDRYALDSERAAVRGEALRLIAEHDPGAMTFVKNVYGPLRHEGLQNGIRKLQSGTSVAASVQLAPSAAAEHTLDITSPEAAGKEVNPPAWQRCKRQRSLRHIYRSGSGWFGISCVPSPACHGGGANGNAG
ncbi:hypothetical protein [Agrobacterium tumefaciens]|uniref:hypothetical protein n=1 Tax=Agrobacterium tumefaciens TaxID=358 RepID=UPI001178CCA3|nr:hypothetical protein [Agrobacterium tumefaciens]